MGCQHSVVCVCRNTCKGNCNPGQHCSSVCCNIKVIYDTRPVSTLCTSLKSTCFRRHLDVAVVERSRSSEVDNVDSKSPHYEEDFAQELKNKIFVRQSKICQLESHGSKSSNEKLESIYEEYETDITYEPIGYANDCRMSKNKGGIVNDNKTVNKGGDTPEATGEDSDNDYDDVFYGIFTPTPEDSTQTDAPGKPKFLEHLLSRVVSRKAGKSRDGNGLVTDAEESIELPAEPLSPDSEKCLQHAEAIVEELLACAARPPSGDSSDSGKGSLFESTSDFSPTEDESFNSAIMESGYVKALVAKINHHKLPEEDHEEQTEDTTEDVDVNGEIIVPVEFLIGKEDSGWSEWEEEVSPSPDDEEGPDSESQEEDEKPRDKLHQIAYELLTTERAYVSRLHLLDQSIQRVGDVMAKLAPFLLLYTECVKNYDKALATIAKWTAQSQKFASLLQEIQDKFHKLLTIIPKLNGEGTSDLVNPTRELIKEGAITKISARSGEKQARYIFLFNDLLLVCSEQMLGSYRIRSRLSVDGMEVNPGENITISGTFCVKCIEKSIEFLDESNNGNGSDWFSVFQQVISDYQKKSRLNRLRSTESASESEFSGSGQFDKSKLGQQAPVWIKDEEVTMCMSCTEKFTRLRRRHHCRACGKVYCGKCTSDRAYLEYEKMRDRDVDPEKDSLMSSYVNIMDKDRKWFRRWATAHSDFVIYIYKKHKDPQAIQTIPLPGHIVKMVEIPDKKHVFALTHKDAVVCHIQAETEEELQQWMSILGKLVLLEIPESRPNRVSTHSDSSGQSTQSSNSSDQSSQL
ncbi:FGD4-like protein [Mya arenaria]|uniref:FGD4-like protein n=1 Tax=Mya arenaria TaxID=6604 RepID=A0ABY7FZL5_MYAAR|nr:FGD4-like protein [Mya arenaria]